MSGYLGLNEYDGLLRVNSHCQVKSCNVKNVLLEFFGILGDRYGVFIYDAVDALMVFLKFYELFKSAEIIAKMDIACGLHS